MFSEKSGISLTEQIKIFFISVSGRYSIKSLKKIHNHIHNQQFVKRKKKNKTETKLISHLN